MKSSSTTPSKKTDRRFVLQVLVIGLLTAFPVIMIAVNGRSAVQAILSSASTEDEEVDSRHDDRTRPREDVKGGLSVAKLRFGVYDPDGEFATDPALAIRHVYISWAAFDADELASRLKDLEKQGYQPLLTVEPWPQEGIEGPLLPAVAAGKYDPRIDALSSVLGELKGPVYVSWGHEMDQDLTERYPWSGREPSEYVAAYRHVVDRIRGQVDTELRWIWAGVLKEGSLRYWPGEKYADFVGMPIYSFPQWDQRTYGFIRDFRATYEEKRKVVAELNKPLMITELGVSGSGDFESFWLHQAFLALDDYPELAAIVFFYARDTEGAWGSDVPTPDWRVHPDAIRGLVEWKLQ